MSHAMLLRPAAFSPQQAAAIAGAVYVITGATVELQALARLFLGAQQSGYTAGLLFFGLGSTTYMYLLVRSRYVPRALALVGLGGSALVVLFVIARIQFPAFVAAAAATVRALPAIALVALAVIFVPILLFELILGFWLLVKGVRIPNQIGDTK